MQKSGSTSAGSNSEDDDSFVDIDEILSNIGRDSISATVELNSSGMAEKVESGIGDGSPADSPYLSEGSTQGGYTSSQNWSRLFTDTILDPITLSDAESVGAESDADYSNPYVSHKTKSGSDFSHVADNEAADGDDLGSGTTNMRPRKRVRFATETEEDPRFVDASSQEITVTLSENLQESEEIPIHGYLTLQAIQSKVVYVSNFLKGFHCILETGSRRG
jgi:hypothetical protein